MNATEKYATIISNQNAAEIALNESKSEFNDYVTARINYLHKVGSSVMNKVLGTHNNEWKFETNSRDYLGHGDLEWFHYWNDSNKVITKADENFIYFRSPQFSNDPKARDLKIDVKFLHMSDRDFAKTIRNKIRMRKAYVKLNAARTAEVTIQKKKAEIEKLQQEIKTLSVNADRIDELNETFAEAMRREQEHRLTTKK